MKRARSAFNIYKSAVYQQIKAINPTFQLGRIATETSIMWRALSETERKPYYDTHNAELLLYPKIPTDFSLLNEAEKADRKKAREEATKDGRRVRSKDDELRRLRFQETQRLREAKKHDTWTKGEIHALFQATQHFGFPRTTAEQTTMALDTVLLQVALPAVVDVVDVVDVSSAATTPPEQPLTFEQYMYRNGGATYFVATAEMLLKDVGQALSYKTAADVQAQCDMILKESKRLKRRHTLIR